jgi:hypothetical protein
MMACRTLGLLTLPSMALLCLGLISCSGCQANKGTGGQADPGLVA